MGDGADSVAGDKFRELRKQFLQEKVYRFQPTLNAIEDANWGKPVRIRINDATWTFRKLSHAEFTLLTNQPYFYKLITGTELDEKETKEWASTQKAMTAALCAEPNKWLEFAEKSPEWVGIVFGALMKESAVDVSKLDEFFDSDYGWNYGLIWFGMMHKTPTEIGRMSEGDYQAVGSWFRKNNERLQKRAQQP